jgi:hypothetical protein
LLRNEPEFIWDWENLEEQGSQIRRSAADTTL